MNLLYGVLYGFIGYLFFLSIILFRSIKRFNTIALITYLFIVLAFLNETLQTLSAKLFHSNILFYNLSSILEFSILLLLYHTIFRNRLISLIFLTLFVLAFVYYVFEIITNGNQIIYSTLFLTRNLCLVCISMLLFRNITKDLEYEDITDNYIFWINLSIFLYYFSTLVIFGIRNIINENQTANLIMMYIHFVLNFLFYGILAFSLKKVSKSMSL